MWDYKTWFQYLVQGMEFCKEPHHLKTTDPIQTQPKSYHEKDETEAAHKSGNFFANRNERLFHFGDGIQPSIQRSCLVFRTR